MIDEWDFESTLIGLLDDGACVWHPRTYAVVRQRPRNVAVFFWGPHGVVLNGTPPPPLGGHNITLIRQLVLCMHVDFNTDVDVV